MEKVECIACLGNIPESEAIEVIENETGDWIYFCDHCWEYAKDEWLFDDDYTCVIPNPNERQV
jgi:hypothetical protein